MTIGDDGIATLHMGRPRRCEHCGAGLTSTVVELCAHCFLEGHRSHAGDGMTTHKPDCAVCQKICAIEGERDRCEARYVDGKNACGLEKGHSGLHECERFKWGGEVYGDYTDGYAHNY